MREMKFSDHLKKILKDRGLKITTVSEETGIPLSTLSEWTGGREPRLSKALLTLSKYLDVSLDTLVIGKDRTELSYPVCESIIEIEGKQYNLKIYGHKKNILED